MRTEGLYLLVCLVCITRGEGREATAPAQHVVLAKILRSVDAATTDEHLFEVTLKLLKSICVCMRDTLRSKEESVVWDSTLIQDAKANWKEVELYKKIYNNTCINLRQELIRKFNQTVNVSDEHDGLSKLGCAKHLEITTESVIHASASTQPVLHENLKSHLSNILFKALIQTNKNHEYKVKKYSLFGRKVPVDNKKQQHSVIVILTLNSNHTDDDEYFRRKASDITESELNKALLSNSTIEIDIIDTKYDPGANETEETESMKLISECVLRSVYVFLIESEKNNLTKVFKVLRKKGTIKIYMEVITDAQDTDYCHTCCKGSDHPMCVDKTTGDQVEAKSSKNKEISKPKPRYSKYKETVLKLRNLVKIYGSKLNNLNTTSGLNNKSKSYRTRKIKKTKKRKPAVRNRDKIKKLHQRKPTPRSTKAKWMFENRATNHNGSNESWMNSKENTIIEKQNDKDNDINNAEQIKDAEFHKLSSTKITSEDNNIRTRLPENTSPTKNLLQRSTSAKYPGATEISSKENHRHTSEDTGALTTKFVSVTENSKNTITPDYGNDIVTRIQNSNHSTNTQSTINNLYVTRTTKKYTNYLSRPSYKYKDVISKSRLNVEDRISQTKYLHYSDGVSRTTSKTVTTIPHLSVLYATTAASEENISKDNVASIDSKTNISYTKAERTLNTFPAIESTSDDNTMTKESATNTELATTHLPTRTPENIKSNYGNFAIESVSKYERKNPSIASSVTLSTDSTDDLTSKTIFSENTSSTDMNASIMDTTYSPVEFITRPLNTTRKSILENGYMVTEQPIRTPNSPYIDRSISQYTYGVTTVQENNNNNIPYSTQYADKDLIENTATSDMGTEENIETELIEISDTELNMKQPHFTTVSDKENDAQDATYETTTFYPDIFEESTYKSTTETYQELLPANMTSELDYNKINFVTTSPNHETFTVENETTESANTSKRNDTEEIFSNVQKYEVSSDNNINLTFTPTATKIKETSYVPERKYKTTLSHDDTRQNEGTNPITRESISYGNSITELPLSERSDENLNKPSLPVSLEQTANSLALNNVKSENKDLFSFSVNTIKNTINAENSENEVHKDRPLKGANVNESYIREVPTTSILNINIRELPNTVKQKYVLTTPDINDEEITKLDKGTKDGDENEWSHIIKKSNYHVEPKPKVNFIDTITTFMSNSTEFPLPTNKIYFKPALYKGNIQLYKEIVTYTNNLSSMIVTTTPMTSSNTWDKNLQNKYTVNNNLTKVMDEYYTQSETKDLTDTVTESQKFLTDRQESIANIHAAKSILPNNPDFTTEIHPTSYISNTKLGNRSEELEYVANQEQNKFRVILSTPTQQSRQTNTDELSKTTIPLDELGIEDEKDQLIPDDSQGTNQKNNTSDQLLTKSTSEFINVTSLLNIGTVIDDIIELSDYVTENVSKNALEKLHYTAATKFEHENRDDSYEKDKIKDMPNQIIPGSIDYKTFEIDESVQTTTTITNVNTGQINIKDVDYKTPQHHTTSQRSKPFEENTRKRETESISTNYVGQEYPNSSKSEVQHITHAQYFTDSCNVTIVTPKKIIQNHQISETGTTKNTRTFDSMVPEKKFHSKITDIEIRNLLNNKVSNINTNEIGLISAYISQEITTPVSKAQYSSNAKIHSMATTKDDSDNDDKDFSSRLDLKLTDGVVTSETLHSTQWDLHEMESNRTSILDYSTIAMNDDIKSSAISLPDKAIIRKPTIIQINDDTDGKTQIHETEVDFLQSTSIKGFVAATYPEKSGINYSEATVSDNIKDTSKFQTTTVLVKYHPQSEILESTTPLSVTNTDIPDLNFLENNDNIKQTPNEDRTSIPYSGTGSYKVNVPMTAYFSKSTLSSTTNVDNNTTETKAYDINNAPRILKNTDKSIGLHSDHTTSSKNNKPPDFRLTTDEKLYHTRKQYRVSIGKPSSIFILKTQPKWNLSKNNYDVTTTSKITKRAVVDITTNNPMILQSSTNITSTFATQSIKRKPWYKHPYLVVPFPKIIGRGAKTKAHITLKPFSKAMNISRSKYKFVDKNVFSDLIKNRTKSARSKYKNLEIIKTTSAKPVSQIDKFIPVSNVTQSSVTKTGNKQEESTGLVSDFKEKRSKIDSIRTTSAHVNQIVFKNSLEYNLSHNTGIANVESMKLDHDIKINETLQNKATTKPLRFAMLANRSSITKSTSLGNDFVSHKPSEIDIHQKSSSNQWSLTFEAVISPTTAVFNHQNATNSEKLKTGVNTAVSSTLEYSKQNSKLRENDKNGESGKDVATKRYSSAMTSKSSEQLLTFKTDENIQKLPKDQTNNDIKELTTREMVTAAFRTFDPNQKKTNELSVPFKENINIPLTKTIQTPLEVKYTQSAISKKDKALPKNYTDISLTEYLKYPSEDINIINKLEFTTEKIKSYKVLLSSLFSANVNYSKTLISDTRIAKVPAKNINFNRAQKTQFDRSPKKADLAQPTIESTVTISLSKQVNQSGDDFATKTYSRVMTSKSTEQLLTSKTTESKQNSPKDHTNNENKKNTTREIITTEDPTTYRTLDANRKHFNDLSVPRKENKNTALTKIIQSTLGKKYTPDAISTKHKPLSKNGAAIPQTEYFKYPRNDVRSMTQDITINSELTTEKIKSYRVFLTSSLTANINNSKPSIFDRRKAKVPVQNINSKNTINLTSSITNTVPTKDSIYNEQPTVMTTKQTATGNIGNLSSIAAKESSRSLSGSSISDKVKSTRSSKNINILDTPLPIKETTIANITLRVNLQSKKETASLSKRKTPKIKSRLIKYKITKNPKAKNKTNKIKFTKKVSSLAHGTTIRNKLRTENSKTKPGKAWSSNILEDTTLLSHAILGRTFNDLKYYDSVTSASVTGNEKDLIEYDTAIKGSYITNEDDINHRENNEFPLQALPKIFKNRGNNLTTLKFPVTPMPNLLTTMRSTKTNTGSHYTTHININEDEVQHNYDVPFKSSIILKNDIDNETAVVEPKIQSSHIRLSLEKSFPHAKLQKFIDKMGNKSIPHISIIDNNLNLSNINSNEINNLLKHNIINDTNEYELEKTFIQELNNVRNNVQNEGNYDPITENDTELENKYHRREIDDFSLDSALKGLVNALSDTEDVNPTTQQSKTIQQPQLDPFGVDKRTTIDDPSINKKNAFEETDANNTLDQLFSDVDDGNVKTTKNTKKSSNSSGKKKKSSKEKTTNLLKMLERFFLEADSNTSAETTTLNSDQYLETPTASIHVLPMKRNESSRNIFDNFSRTENNSDTNVSSTVKTELFFSKLANESNNLNYKIKPLNTRNHISINPEIEFLERRLNNPTLLKDSDRQTQYNMKRILEKTHKKIYIPTSNNHYEESQLSTIVEEATEMPKKYVEGTNKSLDVIDELNNMKQILENAHKNFSIPKSNNYYEESQLSTIIEKAPEMLKNYVEGTNISLDVIEELNKMKRIFENTQKDFSIPKSNYHYDESQLSTIIEKATEMSKKYVAATNIEDHIPQSITTVDENRDKQVGTRNINTNIDRPQSVSVAQLSTTLYALNHKHTNYWDPNLEPTRRDYINSHPTVLANDDLNNSQFKPAVNNLSSLENTTHGTKNKSSTIIQIVFQQYEAPAVLSANNFENSEQIKDILLTPDNSILDELRKHGKSEFVSLPKDNREVDSKIIPVLFNNSTRLQQSSPNKPSAEESTIDENLNIARTMFSEHTVEIISPHSLENVESTNNMTYNNTTSTPEQFLKSKGKANNDSPHYINFDDPKKERIIPPVQSLKIGDDMNNKPSWQSNRNLFNNLKPDTILFENDAKDSRTISKIDTAYQNKPQTLLHHNAKEKFVSGKKGTNILVGLSRHSNYETKSPALKSIENIFADNDLHYSLNNDLSNETNIKTSAKISSTLTTEMEKQVQSSIEEYTFAITELPGSHTKSIYPESVKYTSLSRDILIIPDITVMDADYTTEKPKAGNQKSQIIANDDTYLKEHNTEYFTEFIDHTTEKSEETKHEIQMPENTKPYSKEKYLTTGALNYMTHVYVYNRSPHIQSHEQISQQLNSHQGIATVQFDTSNKRLNVATTGPIEIRAPESKTTKDKVTFRSYTTQPYAGDDTTINQHATELSKIYTTENIRTARTIDSVNTKRHKEVIYNTYEPTMIEDIDLNATAIKDQLLKLNEMALGLSSYRKKETTLPHPDFFDLEITTPLSIIPMYVKQMTSVAKPVVKPRIINVLNEAKKLHNILTTVKTSTGKHYFEHTTIPQHYQQTHHKVHLNTPVLVTPSTTKKITKYSRKFQPHYGAKSIYGHRNIISRKAINNESYTINNTNTYIEPAFKGRDKINEMGNEIQTHSKIRTRTLGTTTTLFNYLNYFGKHKNDQITLAVHLSATLPPFNYMDALHRHNPPIMGTIHPKPDQPTSKIPQLEDLLYDETSPTTEHHTPLTVTHQQLTTANKQRLTSYKTTAADYRQIKTTYKPLTTAYKPTFKTIAPKVIIRTMDSKTTPRIKPTRLSKRPTHTTLLDEDSDFPTFSELDDMNLDISAFKEKIITKLSILNLEDETVTKAPEQKNKPTRILPALTKNVDVKTTFHQPADDVTTELTIIKTHVLKLPPIRNTPSCKYLKTLVFKTLKELNTILVASNCSEYKVVNKPTNPRLSNNNLINYKLNLQPNLPGSFINRIPAHILSANNNKNNNKNNNNNNRPSNPYAKTQLLPVNQIKKNQMIMQQLQMKQNKKEIIAMNTQDFFSQKRFVTQKNLGKNVEPNISMKQLLNKPMKIQTTMPLGFKFNFKINQQQHLDRETARVMNILPTISPNVKPKYLLNHYVSASPLRESIKVILNKSKRPILKPVYELDHKYNFQAPPVYQLKTIPINFVNNYGPHHNKMGTSWKDKPIIHHETLRHGALSVEQSDADNVLDRHLLDMPVEYKSKTGQENYMVDVMQSMEMKATQNGRRDTAVTDELSFFDFATRRKNKESLLDHNDFYQVFTIRPQSWKKHVDLRQQRKPDLSYDMPEIEEIKRKSFRTKDIPARAHVNTNNKNFAIPSPFDVDKEEEFVEFPVYLNRKSSGLSIEVFPRSDSSSHSAPPLPAPAPPPPPPTTAKPTSTKRPRRTIFFLSPTIKYDHYF